MRNRYWVHLALLAALTLGACDNFDLYTMLDGRPPGQGDEPRTALALNATEISLYAGGTYAFAATGGVPPYVYSTVSGSGTIDASTGLYTASAESGTDVIRVTDYLDATQDATVHVLEGITFLIVPSAVELGVGATMTFVTTGGVSPVTFAVVSGGGSVDAEGVYTAPASPGAAVIRATDALGNQADAAVTVVSDLEFSIVPGSVILYVNNIFTFTVLGGTPPYTYTMESGAGALAGGQFTAPSSQGVSEVRVTDSLGATDVATITVLLPFGFGPATARLDVNEKLSFTTTGGLAPYTYEVITGSGTIDGAGVYTAPASADQDVIRVEDSVGNVRIAAVVVDAVPPLAITPATVTLNVNDDFTFQATGGQTPYAFTVSGGGTVGSTTGDYTAPGTQGAATIRVTDDLGAFEESLVTIVNATAPLAIHPAILEVPQGVLVYFRGTGGDMDYTYSLAGGTGTVNGSQGTYRAPNGGSGGATVGVTDGLLATADATVIILPGPPDGLVADGAAGASDAIRLTWTDRATGEEGFSIERRSGAGAFGEVATVGPDGVTYDDVGLSEDTVYVYRVRAYAGGVYSPYSGEVFAVSNP